MFFSLAEGADRTKSTQAKGFAETDKCSIFTCTTTEHNTTPLSLYMERKFEILFIFLAPAENCERSRKTKEGGIFLLKSHQICHKSG